MYELKKIGKVLTSKSVGTGPSSYEKSIYRAAVSQRLRNTGQKDRIFPEVLSIPARVWTVTAVLACQQFSEVSTVAPTLNLPYKTSFLL